MHTNTKPQLTFGAGVDFWKTNPRLVTAPTLVGVATEEGVALAELDRCREEEGVRFRKELQRLRPRWLPDGKGVWLLLLVLGAEGKLLFSPMRGSLFRG